MGEMGRCGCPLPQMTPVADRLAARLACQRSCTLLFELRLSPALTDTNLRPRSQLTIVAAQFSETSNLLRRSSVSRVIRGIWDMIAAHGQPSDSIDGSGQRHCRVVGRGGTARIRVRSALWRALPALTWRGDADLARAGGLPDTPSAL